MSGNIKDVRQALFDELRQLRGDNPNLERAKAVREVCKVLIDSAKVEVDYINATGGNAAGSGFIPSEPTKVTQTSDLPNGILSITRHTMPG